MSISVPSDTQRWRCTQCGNLTRFDVTRSVRSRDYLHFDLSGGSRVEESQTLAETIEEVRCRWCNAVDAVETVDRPDAGAAESA
ncbi:hypothetical protein ACFPZ0_15610 [Streptomonospora nanhaiensis]|uniref:hypothetical protein n=1 Tax=Streptomonospora nanhaiensis TaxID=1323731 RepID=UPI0015C7B161|nr:hypothetical protein [Streptomonospora nanhaiensis]MBV2362398.1 hypothetical protein [Streptomonospora nanhaiensis]MBX9389115.1 hypothetical protein [Streptomonospora nanhaiensis]